MRDSDVAAALAYQWALMVQEQHRKRLRYAPMSFSDGGSLHRYDDDDQSEERDHSGG